MPRSAETCFAAAMGGSVAKLQYLVEAEGCPLPADISKTAVLLGSKSMLAFLKQQGVAFTADTARRAAHLGLVPIIEFLHAEGCPFDEPVCSAALAQRGTPTCSNAFES
jgi:hypothetical protein